MCRDGVRDKAHGIGGTFTPEVIGNSFALVKALNRHLCRHSYETESARMSSASQEKFSFVAGSHSAGRYQPTTIPLRCAKTSLKLLTLLTLIRHTPRTAS